LQNLPGYTNIPNYIYVEIKGKKPEKTPDNESSTLFQPTGLQLLFVLLTDNELLRKGGKGTREMELAEKLYNKYIAQDLDES
jgi:hypothetical protein